MSDDESADAVRGYPGSLWMPWWVFAKGHPTTLERREQPEGRCACYVDKATAAGDSAAVSLAGGSGGLCRRRRLGSGRGGILAGAGGAGGAARRRFGDRPGRRAGSARTDFD